MRQISGQGSLNRRILIPGQTFAKIRLQFGRPFLPDRVKCVFLLSKPQRFIFPQIILCFPTAPADTEYVGECLFGGPIPDIRA